MRRLLIRPGAIGDCVLSLPALERLQVDYTEVWISGAAVPLIQFGDRVHSIASTGLDLVGVGDLEMPVPLRGRLRSFDSIRSWYGANRPPFREALQCLGIPCEFYAALPPPSYSGHAIDFFAQQVGAADGLTPKLHVTPGQRRETVVIHPFSGSPRKNWPLRSFLELAERLPCRVEWTAGPEEELPRSLPSIRFANLLHLADWLAGARLYIGNDSGITHLAAASGVPTLALFGETKPEVWAPRGTNVTILQHTPLADLSVGAVLDAICQLLRLG